MKAPRFEYERPRTLDDALLLLAQGGAGAKVIAGGQSLGPLLNFRLAQPELLIDVRTLPELTAATEEADAVVLGACVTHAAIEDGRVPDPSGGLMSIVARGIAYRAVRNRGTLGGSLAHADPAADWLSVMALLDAEVVACSRVSERKFAAAALATGPLSTQLDPNELIVAIRIPRVAPSARSAYYKVNRKPGEFADAIAGVLVDRERGVCRAVLGATEGAPHVVADATACLSSTDACDAVVSSAGFLPRTYAHQVHRVALQRAAARLQ